MLRISTIPNSNGTCFQLEGSLTGSWVEELRRAVEQALAQSPAVLLDLQQLWYIDPDGVALLRDLGTRRVAHVNGSPFIQRQLETGSAADGTPR